MEAAEKNRGTAAMNGVSTDVMHKFLKRNRLENENEEKAMEEDEEIELSLGLSMNGRFGVDPTRKKLRRSSSVSNVVVNINSVDNGSNPQARGVASGGHAALVRTCSLPSESHEWRRREEFQSVGGVEAGGERMEELNIVRVEKEKEKDNCSDEDRLHGDANGSFSVERLDSESPNRFENWNSTQSPQRLIERGGSSGISHLQRQLVKEATQNPITKGSSSRQFPQEPVAQRPAVTATDNGATDDESVKNPLVDMPYVSTRGYGPNHNKIEGFLYGYKRGEEVKIVCVCHGMFLSPAEFVKHGGGGDVAYPLKHIVVNPFPLY